MLILMAHGSRDPTWCDSVEKLVESLQTDFGRDDVRLAYMECTPPTLMDAVADAVRAGAGRVGVLPLFLTGEGHVARDVRRLVGEVREAHRSVEVEILPPVGQHRLFLELLCTIAAENAPASR